MTDPVIEWPCSDYALAALSAAHLQENLTADGRNGAASTVVVHHGQRVPGYAEIGNGCASMAWARIAGVSPADPNTIGACGVLEYLVEIELGVWRCLPAGVQRMPDANIDSAARDVLDDREQMRRAITAVENQTECEVKIGRWRPLGPTGGIHGGALTFTIRAELGVAPDGIVPPLPGDPVQPPQ